MMASRALSIGMCDAAPSKSVKALSQPARRAPEIVLDVSRLLSRILHPVPTGVDRVEMAYARTLLRRIPDRLLFGAVHPITRRYGRLPTHNVVRFLDETEARWELHGGWETKAARHVQALRTCWRLRPRPVSRPSASRVLVQASPHHLDRVGTVRNKLRRERARYICLIHDIIPISHPEYARPGGSALHWKRLSTLGTYANGLIANSAATANALRTAIGDELGERPVRIAPLGVRRPVRECRHRDRFGENFFVCLGTIEPRKNHLMLLQIWRALVAEGGEQVPMLIIIGRRGWENENIVDLLDRCAFAGRVREYGGLPDAAVRSLIQDARAVLMPSFAEGFGLPIAEALAAGVPVIASDIPAHREAGGEAAEYLDPIDGKGWRDAVLAYCQPNGPRRAAQLARIADWRPATWESHIDAALSLAEEVAEC